MSDVSLQPRKATARDLRYFRTPQLWQTWPFLPVIRRQPDGELEYGILYDCWTISRQAGFSSTVILTNLFLLPRTEAELLALPKEVFDTAEEIGAAGWVVD